MATSKYKMVIIFTKHTNLLPWFDTTYSKQLADDYQSRSVGFNQLRQSYAQERDVQLILLVRYDDCGNLFCKIKCPINPLPIRGEFNAVSLRGVINYLVKDGWTEKQRLPFGLLK